MPEEKQSAGEKLKEKVREFPAQPGVYLMKDKNGKVIYVGKAGNLRSRVGSYFNNKNPVSRQAMLVSKIADIEYILTGTEMEALITENRLIKEYQPRYNVSLKDDKSYPYLKITPELYPRLELVRLPEKNGGRGNTFSGAEPVYFGPYTEVRPVRRTLRFLGKLFPLRTCRQPLEGDARGRPCLNFQMKRCLGPCRGRESVSPEDYGSLVSQISLFLSGKQNDLIKKMERQMKEAAQEMDFEKAAVLRDRLDYLRSMVASQKILALPDGDYDVIGLIRLEEETENENRSPKEQISVYMHRIREGRLKEREHFILRATQELPEEEIMAGFLKNYYSRGVLLPAEIIVSQLPAEEDLLQEWLSRQYGTSLKFSLPQRGLRRDLMESCLQEGYAVGKEKLRRGNRVERAKEEEAEQALRELEKITGQTGIKRIEGYDISHLRGGEAVGSMVVFQEGFPFKNGYRRFRIRQKLNGDDCRAMEEVFRRRLEHPEMPYPDLVLVDGGAAQLNALHTVLAGKKVQTAILSLAKKHEEIYIPGEKIPLRLPGNSPSLGLLRRIRDEAHRFALTYHRKLRAKEASLSSLDRVPGIGAQRKAAILRHFGGMDRLFRASPDDFREVPGISEKLALIIYEHLHR